MIRRAFVVTPLTAILGLLVADRILAPSGDFLSDNTWQIIGIILAFSGTIVLLFIGGSRAIYPLHSSRSVRGHRCSPSTRFLFPLNMRGLRLCTSPCL